ncbi:hypothetical protein [Ichthyobacterium seriolicida]|uniref:Lipoprotein n=1 Tax=Ichthyobacterium seriolicida TaxID=242600 RepID=A0A1J1E733_9FLAO|nr:hypothetical protein [Ichthyobacterium seriolicida]BAV95150.1 hypothetical protein JBKA6_1137 [Ichthyobacterium seriolicida]
MKTNKVFKNILSLLTLGLVVFSCNKPGEGSKTEEEAIKNTIANIKRIVFTKAKNSTPATNPNTATPAYAALFVKKTPAVTYADLDTEFPAVIQGDTVIKVTVPFDKTLNISTAATLTATITLNEKPGENVYLGETKLTDSTVPFDYEISTQLVHAELKKTAGVSQILEIKRKDKDGNVLIKKSFKVVFIHNIPSNLCTITKFALKKPTSGTTTPTGNAKIKDGATGLANGILVLTPKESTGNGNANSTPIEYEFKKDDHTENSGLAANDILKVDGMVLPNGATISTDGAVTSSDTAKNPIEEGITIPSTVADTSIFFKIVAQDGITEKFYKFTYKHT